MATFLIIALLAGAGWYALSSIFKEPPPPAPLPPPAAAVPKQLKVKIVDAGSMRFVDLRAIPKDALVTREAINSVADSLRPLPSVACTCFVAPPQLTELASELSDTAQVIFWGRFQEAAHGSSMTSVYVDGPQPDGKSIAWAKEVGVEVLLEWPQIIGTDPSTGAPRTWTGREILSA